MANPLKKIRLQTTKTGAPFPHETLRRKSAQPEKRQVLIKYKANLDARREEPHRAKSSGCWGAAYLGVRFCVFYSDPTDSGYSETSFTLGMP